MATTTTSGSCGETPKLQLQMDRARLETTRLRELLTAERSAIRALKAAHSADMRKERSLARRREQELMTQLNQAQRAQFENPKSSECEECNKIRNDCEAELRKERTELKKKENCLMAQINELKNLKNVDKKNRIECEECVKLRCTHEGELRKERNDFKRKETDLMTQVNDLKNQTKLCDKSIKTECQECLKLTVAHETELKKERNDFKRKELYLLFQLNELKNNKLETSDKNKKLECDNCIKLRITHENELKKEKYDLKRKETLLNSQISDLTKELSTTKLKLSDKNEEIPTLRKNYEAELKRDKQEFRRKESYLQSQLNELKCKINNVIDKKSDNCDQCARFKAIIGAELKRERCEFKKKEAQLQSQLFTAQRINNDVKKGADDKSGECEQCVKLNKDIGKLKDLLKELEDKIERIQEADRLKSVDFRSQHDRHVAELARVTRSARQDARKLLEELKTKDRIIEQMKRNAQTTKKPASDNISMRKLRDGDRKIEHTSPPISTAACDPKTDNTLYEKVPPTELFDPRPPVDDPGSQPPPGEEENIASLGERLLQAEAELSRLQTHLQQSEDVIQQLKQYNRDQDRRDQLTAKQRREMFYRSPGHELEPVAEEDTDSAVSSAPSSLSPQPYPGAPCFQQGPFHPVTTSSVTSNGVDCIGGDTTPPPTSLSPQPPLSEGYTSPPDSPQPPGITDGDVWGDKVNESELSIAKRQVRELEKALLVTRGVKNDSRHNQITATLTERVKCLEAREASLLHEIGDLREQNELLEFRILELEECHDKWSLRSNTPPDTRDVWTDTESDSGVGSLCLEPEDKVRSRLMAISQATCEPEDRDCLLRVLALLESLEALSKEQALYMEEKLEAPSVPPVQIKSQQFGYTSREKQPNRIVATVLPFTEYQQQEQAQEYIEEGERNDGQASDKLEEKKHIWNSLCLQESGIFEGDPPEFNSQGTQTDPFFQDQPNNKALDLTAEIQKLNQFRESIEVGNKAKKLLVSSDQKYLKEINFYKDRLDVLEKKLQIFESSGDVQAKHLAERLNREVYLASQVKELSNKVQKLHTENFRLEEERCELEEAENDTRLRCQQLEAEIEALSDRLKAMEDSKLSAKRKAKDAKSQATYWESMVNKYEERNYELEERECELRHRLEVMECTTPAILLFNMWKVMQNNPNAEIKDMLMDKLKEVGKNNNIRPQSPSSCSCNTEIDDTNVKIKTLESERQKLVTQKQNMENKVKHLEKELCTLKGSVKNPWGDQHSLPSIHGSDIDLIKELQTLTEKENDMKKKITELERREMAYMETLQQADDIWADMENGYKKRICAAEQNEQSLRKKLQKFEKSDERDDRIQELEQTEKCLRDRVGKLEKELQRLLNTNKGVKEELDTCICNFEDKLTTAHSKYSGDMSREKKKYKNLKEELKTTQKFKAEAGKAYEAEINSLKEQLSKTRKELVHLDVTNSELREEVYTLESKISEMEKQIIAQCTKDTEAIKGLSKELKVKDAELAMARSKVDSLQSSCSCSQNGSVAHQLPEISLNEMAKRLSTALKNVERCVECAEIATPDLMQTVDGIKSLCELMEYQGTMQGNAPKVPARRRWL